MPVVVSQAIEARLYKYSLQVQLLKVLTFLLSRGYQQMHS